MEEWEDHSSADRLTMRALLRGIWRLPWVCAGYVVYVLERRVIAWIGHATIGRGIRYT